MRKYGWPIALFMGGPFIAIFLSNVYYYAFDSGFITYDSILLQPALWSLTRAVLLGVLFLWVRSNERPTLRLVWSCALMLAAVFALVSLCAVLAGYDSLASAFVVWMLIDLVNLVLLLWFARRASRLSLSHAFFLVVVVGGLSMPDLLEALPFYYVWLLRMAASVLAVWLLANFDLRSRAFRRRSAVGLVALEGLGVLMPLVLALSGVTINRSTDHTLLSVLLLAASVFFFILPLVLVYLVRVRHPQTKVPPATPRE